MGSAAVRTGPTPQEYLAMERASATKHELANGAIVARSGGTFEHSAIAANLVGELGAVLVGQGCQALTSDMRIKIHATDRYVYPDGAVVCGGPEFEDETRDILLNPRVIIEVLSDSTEAYDRGDKFDQYRAIPSFQEYVLASQKAPRIEVFTRQAEGGWLLHIHGPGERVELASLGCVVEVDRVYGGVLALEAPAP
jgi:Uma2 family endonuclease